MQKVLNAIQRAREGEVARERENQSSSSAERFVNSASVERVHLPRNNNHEVAWCWVVVSKVPEANHGVVHYHKVTLEESETERRNHSQRSSGKKKGSITGTRTARRAYPTVGRNQKNRKSIANSRQKRASKIWRKIGQIPSLTPWRNLSPKQARDEADKRTKGYD